MKYFSLLLFLVSSLAWSQVPNVKGQNQSGNLYVPNIQTPDKQVTKLNGTTALIETGNTNMFPNPGFEAADTSNVSITTISGGCTKITSASGSDPMDGKRSLVMQVTEGECYYDFVLPSYNMYNEGKSAYAGISLRSSGVVPMDFVKVSVLSGTTVLATGDYSAPLNAAFSPVKTIAIPFTMGSSSPILRVHLKGSATSINTQRIIADSVFIGEWKTPLGFSNEPNNGGWKSSGGIVFSGATPPTKATTKLYDSITYRQEGDFYYVEVNYKHTSNAGAANGTGDYIFTLPSGVEFDPSYALYTGNTSSFNARSPSFQSEFWAQDSTNTSFGLIAHPYSSNTFRIRGAYVNSSNGTIVTDQILGPSFFGMSSSTSLTIRGYLKFKGKGLTATTPIVSQNAYAIRAGQTIRGGWSACPAGTVERDGRSLSIAKWPELYAALGTKHGNGLTAPAGVANDAGCPAASGCFNIPDARGRLDRHIDGGTGRDENAAARTAMATGGNAGNAVGSVEVDEIKSHKHLESGMWPGADVNKSYSNANGQEIRDAANAQRTALTASSFQGISPYTNLTGGTENQVDTAYDMSCVQLESTNITAHLKESSIVKDVWVSYSAFVSANGSATAPTACGSGTCNTAVRNDGNKYSVTASGAAYTVIIADGTFKPNTAVKCNCVADGGYCYPYTGETIGTTSANASGGFSRVMATGLVNSGNGAHNGATRPFWVTCEGVSPLAP